MEATVTHSPLNPSQLFILKTFATAKSEQEKEELTSFYLAYIQERLKKLANEFWDEHNLDDAKMDEIMHGHLRASKK